MYQYQFGKVSAISPKWVDHGRSFPSVLSYSKSLWCGGPWGSRVVQVSSFEFILSGSAVRVGKYDISYPIGLLGQSVIVDPRLLVYVVIVSFVRFSAVRGCELS